MQTLAQTLQDHDRGHLEVIANLWGLDLPNGQKPITIDALSSAMLDRTPAILETLPEGAKRALLRILEGGGRVPMETLVRQFGPLREMGSGKRDRLEPWKEPASPLEMLWYRGLMSRAFADSTGGPQEFGFVPDDLLRRMPEVDGPERRPLGTPAATPDRFLQTQTDIVDDATTLLAASRRAAHLDRSWLRDYLHHPDSLTLLEDLLVEQEIFESPDRIRDFLELPRHEAASLLREGWRTSRVWNDLSHTPGVSSPTGKWPNDPLAARTAALELFETIPVNRWWSIPSMIAAVQEAHPGFMRPPGGFDSWYLQSKEDGSSLRGFEAWDQVEGHYLRYLVRGPMLWLGLADISQGGDVLRLPETDSADRVHERGKARAWPDGRIQIARAADRTLRYQISRLCEWEKMDRGAYYFRITATALSAAEGLGLTPGHAVKVLAEIPAPESIMAAVERWNERGREAVIQRQTILRVENPKTLKMLLEHPTTRPYLLEQLGPNTVVVDENRWGKLQEAALRLGLLIGRSSHN